MPRAYVPRLLVTAALFRLLARALLRLFGAITLAVAIVVIVESGADYFVFVRVFVRIFVRILAALLRRLAPALTSGVDFTILFAALAVLLGIESGAEDMAAALGSADFASRRRPVDRNEEARTSLIVLRVYAARRRNRWSLVANGLVGSSVRFGKIARGIQRSYFSNR